MEMEFVLKNVLQVIKMMEQEWNVLNKIVIAKQITKMMEVGLYAYKFKVLVQPILKMTELEFIVSG